MLQDVVIECNSLNIKKTFTRAKPALAFLLDNPELIDIVFVDIKMPEMDGFGFLRELQSYPVNPCVIFVTGFEEYAIEAFRAAAFDFLLKPVTKEDIEQALIRYKKKCLHEQLVHKAKILFERLEPAEKLVFPHHRGFNAYHPHDIISIIADGNYSILKLISGKEQLVTIQIGQIDSIIKNTNFFRINRSCIINTRYLTKADFKCKCCCLSYDGEELEIETTPKRIKELQHFLLKN